VGGKIYSLELMVAKLNLMSEVTKDNMLKG
jgi:hypothetical protein